MKDWADSRIPDGALDRALGDPYRKQAYEYAAQARRHGYSAKVLEWACAMDNYEPFARQYAHGAAVRYAGTLVRADGSRAEYPAAGITMFCHDDQLPLGNLITGPHAVALFDYGSSVEPYYLAGYNPYETDKQRDPELHWGSGAYVLWHAFPTAQPGEMTKGNPSRPLDYSNWLLGPRKAYHFKTTVLT